MSVVTVFPNVHPSINNLPSVLGSMLEIKTAVQVIAEGCALQNNDRETFEQTLTEQLNYRLPLGWKLVKPIKYATRDITNNLCVYVLLCPFNVPSSDMEAAKHGQRLRVELINPHPMFKIWLPSPAAPSHMFSDRHY